jgi:DNA polymerase
MSQGAHTQLGCEGVLELVPEEYAIKLPNGLLLRYADLSAEAGEKGLQYSYKTRQGRAKIYGGKVVENVVQALARIVVGEQMVRVAKKYRPVLTVHDAVACIAPQEEAGQGRLYVEECMRWVPAWALGLPVNCESGVGKSYGEC